MLKNKAFTRRINEIFEELKPDEDECQITPRHIRAMNTVSGYFGDWTRWLNKSGGEPSETDLLSHNHQQHLIHHHHEVPYFSNVALLNAGGAIYSSQISGGSG